MKTIAEIRLDNLEALLIEMGTQEKLAEVGETSSVYLSQIRNRAANVKSGKLRTMGDDMARKLEAGCKKEVGWMDNIHTKGEADSAPLVYPTAFHSPPEGARANEPIPLPVAPVQYDIWTTAAINLLQQLDLGQRQAMVARMREYKQYLAPPHDGQTLHVAD